MDCRDAQKLRLIVAGCAPALDCPDPVALTLHTVCDLTIAEVARAFLVPTTTMARRLAQAKARTRHAAIDDPDPDPDPRVWEARLPCSMATLYLLFNAGYAATQASGRLRRDRCADAIALARLLRTRFAAPPPELDALLALMLLHEARRATRYDARGDLVPLAEQDRARWNAALIAEGCALASAALAGALPGPYALEAAIAAVHATARRADQTDWRRVVALYQRLLALQPSPVVALNHAIAVSMAQGALAALPLVDALAEPLADHPVWHATRADVLRRLDRVAEAIGSYRRAHALAVAEAERRFLMRRLRELQWTGD